MGDGKQQSPQKRQVYNCFQVYQIRITAKSTTTNWINLIGKYKRRRTGTIRRPKGNTRASNEEQEDSSTENFLGTQIYAEKANTAGR